jgi:hypothetical protein
MGYVMFHCVYVSLWSKQRGSENSACYQEEYRLEKIQEHCSKQIFTDSRFMQLKSPLFYKI